MTDEELRYMHFWRPDWCPLKNECHPKILSISKDLCFGTDTQFRVCINFDNETFTRFVEMHDPEKPAIAFLSLSRKDLQNLYESIGETLKFSTGVDTDRGVNADEELWKIKSKQVIVKQDTMY
jgi:hypothetical protein